MVGCCWLEVIICALMQQFWETTPLPGDAQFSPSQSHTMSSKYDLRSILNISSLRCMAELFHDHVVPTVSAATCIHNLSLLRWSPERCSSLQQLDKLEQLAVWCQWGWGWVIINNSIRAVIHCSVWKAVPGYILYVYFLYLYLCLLAVVTASPCWNRTRRLNVTCDALIDGCWVCEKQLYDRIDGWCVCALNSALPRQWQQCSTS